MRRIQAGFNLFVLCLMLVQSGLPQSANKLERPIGIFERWNQILNARASNDGNWFAYWLKKKRGPSKTTEAIVRRTLGDQEGRFSLSWPEGTSGIAAGTISFSEDSTWVAFHASVVVRTSKSPITDDQVTSRVLLVNLLTREKTEFENIKRFSFSRQSKWIALHKNAPSNHEKGVGSTASSTLKLRELATGNERLITNVAEFAFDHSGNWLAWTVDAPGEIGNGIYLRNMKTGREICLDTDTATYSKLAWTEKGDALTLLKGRNIGEEKSFSVMGFSDLSATLPAEVTYDPLKDKDFPTGMVVNDAKSPRWMEDLSGILFDVYPSEEKNEGRLSENVSRESKTDESDRNIPAISPHSEKPDLVLWHWRRDESLRSEFGSVGSREGGSSFLCIYRVREKRFIRLADESVKQVDAGAKGRWAIGLDTRPYDRNNSFWRSNGDVYLISLTTGERRLALKNKIMIDKGGFYKPSPNWDAFLYFDDGQFFIYDMETNQSRNITREVPTSFSDDVKARVKQSFSYRSDWIWSRDGKSVLLPDAWDIWSIPIRGGRATNLTVNGKKDRIRYRFIHQRCLQEGESCTLDEEVAAGRPLYLHLSSDQTKKEGIARLEEGKRGAEILLWEDAHFDADYDHGGQSFFRATLAERLFFTKETFKDYPDWYLTDNSFQQIHRLTDGNPDQKDFFWPGGYRVVEYTSDRGDKLRASLMLPANYRPSRKYPTIVYIYSNQSRRINHYPMSWEDAFEPSVYASNGYAVLMPDIAYKLNDPGMSVVWSVLPAVKAAVSTGIVDPKRLGIYGHSFGGYETEFLITQTNIFAAAVAAAGFSDLVGAYNSLRGSEIENSYAQQGYFESGQGRLGPLWDNLEAYKRNSPIYYAPKIKTPVLIWHNEKDSAVDVKQDIEYFNALRWLGKPVIMLEYKGEEHSFSYPESWGHESYSNQKDCSIRMHEFFEHYLKDKPAPKWMEKGTLR